MKNLPAGWKSVQVSCGTSRKISNLSNFPRETRWVVKNFHIGGIYISLDLYIVFI
jgi:hypothetical protein